MSRGLRRLKVLESQYCLSGVCLSEGTSPRFSCTNTLQAWLGLPGSPVFLRTDMIGFFLEKSSGPKHAMIRCD